jgi:hypothetical protein
MNPAHKNITVVAIDFKTHDMTRRALEITLDRMTPKEVVVISDQDILPGSTWVPCKPTKTFTEYNELMLKWVWPLIDTSHALYVQYDGMVWDPDQWTDDFLNYDYIGATWPWAPEGQNMGNGGFSLRSKRLLDACKDPAIRLTAARNYVAEDAVICVDNRVYLETQYDIKFAPTDVANRFSYELGGHGTSWGFHGLWNVLGRVSITDLDFYMERLTFENWNQHLWHHVLVVLAQRGIKKYLDIVIRKFKFHAREHMQPLLVRLGKEQFTNKDWLVLQLQAP